MCLLMYTLLRGRKFSPIHESLYVRREGHSVDLSTPTEQTIIYSNGPTTIYLTTPLSVASFRDTKFFSQLSCYPPF
jgi:hypothetical protein